jgi:hypothetical protein
MFWFTKKTKLHQLEDTVWWNDIAKNTALNNYFEKCKLLNEQVVVVTFFPETFDRIVQMLERKLIPFAIIESGFSLQNVKSDTLLFLFKAEAITKSNVLSQFVSFLKIDAFTVLLPEHYPLRSMEKELFAKMEETQVEIDVKFYVSMDEDFFYLFGSERIKELMAKMGMKEDEPLEHNMITKSIQRCQEKIEKSVPFESKAKSMKEWFRLNKVV